MNKPRLIAQFMPEPLPDGTADHRTCDHDFVPLPHGEVSCTVCGWFCFPDELSIPDDEA